MVAHLAEVLVASVVVAGTAVELGQMAVVALEQVGQTEQDRVLADSQVRVALARRPVAAGRAVGTGLERALALVGQVVGQEQPVAVVDTVVGHLGLAQPPC